MIEINIESIENSLNGVLSELGWTKESLFSKSVKVQCPLNPGHMVHESVLLKHVEICSWLKEGYSREDMENALPCSNFFYKNATSVVPVTTDKELLSKICSEVLNEHQRRPFEGISERSGTKQLNVVPQTMERYTVEYTPQERCAVYDYVVNKGKEINKIKEVTVNDLLFEFECKDEKDNKPKSHLEILAEQRDYKRRRPTYRAKNVHITKKSYTEILREVIENQSGLLADLYKQEKNTHHEKKSFNLDEDNERTPRGEDSGHKSSHRSYRDKNFRSYDKSHHKRKRSRSRSRERHSDSHRHKSHHKDKKHKKRH